MEMIRAWIKPKEKEGKRKMDYVNGLRAEPNLEREGKDRRMLKRCFLRCTKNG